MYKLILADDEYFVRIGMRETIDWEKLNVEYSGDADNGSDALKLACEIKPDIIITDIRMPGLDGLELIDACLTKGLKAQFIVMSAHNDFNYAKRALQMGACDYILKPAADEQLIKAVEKAIQNIEKEKQAVAYKDAIDNYKSVIKEHLLLNLAVNTSLNEDEIRRELQTVSLNIQENCNYVVFIKIIDYHIQLNNRSHTEINEFQSALRKTADECLKNFNNNYWWATSAGSDNFVIIIHNTDEEKQAVSDLKNVMNDFCLKMEKLYPEFALTIGISRQTNGLCGFSQGYTQAYVSAHHNAVSKKSSVNTFYDKDGGEYRREIIEALNYISMHYAEDISIESIASQLYMSPSHLMHLFKNAIGKTLNECITEYRIQAAKFMLRNSKCNVNEVAMKCGYNNTKYFTRVFKRHTDMTPSEYSRKPY